jgi:hypothetical protein
MHSCAPTPPSPATPRQALRGLVCLVLLGWVGKPATARIKSDGPARPDHPSAPYLRVTGSLPLRFQEVPVPPAPVARTAASGPPFPATSVTQPMPAISTPDDATPETLPPTGPMSAAAPSPVATPPAIIPDETRPRVQPEDFLPFFQFPGSTGAPGDVRVIAPLNFPPPPAQNGTPSTATYRQQ